jgi:hypothetical protein
VLALACSIYTNLILKYPTDIMKTVTELNFQRFKNVGIILNRRVWMVGKRVNPEKLITLFPLKHHLKGMRGTTSTVKSSIYA